MTVDPPLPTTPPPPPGITVSIDTSGTNTAGETYNLMCSASVTGSTDQPSITWLEGDVEISNSTTRTVSAPTMRPSGGSYSNTLTFSPLAASHAGTYTCRATAAGNLMDTGMMVVSIQSK